MNSDYLIISHEISKMFDSFFFTFRNLSLKLIHLILLYWNIFQKEFIIKRFFSRSVSLSVFHKQTNKNQNWYWKPLLGKFLCNSNSNSKENMNSTEENIQL